MRRIIPWALVLLIGVGAAAGAALGASSSGTAAPAVLEGSAAQRWLHAVLAATRAAGTAHVHGVTVIESPNPNLRGSGSESGVVDFTNGDIETTDVDHSYQWSSENGGPAQRSSVTDRETQIVIGRTTYDDPGLGFGWQRSTTSGRNAPESLVFGGLGFGGGVDLFLMSAPAESVRRVASATLSGEATTQFLVQFAIPTPCPHTKPLRATTSVWVDGQGRMVQTRNSFSFDTSAFPKDLPGMALPRSLQGRSTYVITTRLSDFGKPVRVRAPDTRTDQGSSGAFTGTLLKGSSGTTTSSCSGVSAGGGRSESP